MALAPKGKCTYPNFFKGICRNVTGSQLFIRGKWQFVCRDHLDVMRDPSLGWGR